MKTRFPAVAATVVCLAVNAALANSGVQLSLNQYQAGNEETSAAPITNPGFETVDGSNNPIGWTPDSPVMNVGAADPANLPSPAGVIGARSARAFQTGGIDPFSNYKYSQLVTLQPDTDYVISTYIWGYGVSGQPPTNDLFAGDLAVVEVVDPANVFNSAGVILEPTALDNGAGSRGYFVYKTFNSAQFASSAYQVNLEVEFDPNENIAFAQNRPERSAQFDNIGMTPLNQFAAQKFTAAGGGSWGTAGNWVNGPADAKGAVASFKTASAGAASVTLGGVNRTVAVINFDAAGGYAINGPGTLTLDHEEFRDAVILNNFQGSHSINVPILVGSGTTGSGAGSLQTRAVRLNVGPAGSVMTLSQPMSPAVHPTLGAGTFTVTKVGAGRLDTAPIRAQSLTINQGNVRVLPNATQSGQVGTLTLAGAATPTVRLELANSALVVDYTGDSPLALIRQQILAGQAGGPGIASGSGSAFAVGYGEATELGSVPAIFGTVDSTSVLLRGTLKGDSNLSGVVDIDDFGILAANFNQPGPWTKGDSNYSGTVDIDDFGLLAANFNQSSVLPGAGLSRAGAVPEPTVGAVSILGMALARRRVRK